MKKLALAMVVAILALAMVGCASSSSSSSSVVSSAAPSSSAPQAPASIRGTVVDATMNTVTIQVPNGTEYTFATEGAEIDSPDGLLLGDEITIHYTGELKEDEQVQDLVVTSITVEVAAAGGDSSTITAAPTEDVKSIEGTIEQYDGGDTMMIVDATGVDFLFSLEGADLHVGEEGFAVGDVVIIYYYGELVDQPEVQNVTVGEVKKADQ